MASKVGTISLGPWGGSGGSSWSFMAKGGITGIIIKLDDGNHIQSISFKDASGVTSSIFGGNGSGEEKKIPIFWPSEYLTAISGTCRGSGVNVITSLKFTTNANTYGPIGEETTGNAFSIPIKDSVVVGFHGRYGGYLDALGILVQPDGSVSLGPWGGPDGTTGHFSFKVENWIREITIYHGENCIVGIAVKDANGKQYEEIGDARPYNQDTIEIVGPTEYVTSITGTYGGNNDPHRVVTSLFIKTNLKTHGRYGTESGTSFSIPMNNSLVVGFHGRLGQYIEAIGIFVKPQLAI